MTDRADALPLTEELADSVLEGSIGQLAERLLTVRKLREYRVFAQRFHAEYRTAYDAILTRHSYLNLGHAAEAGLYRTRDGELRAARTCYLHQLIMVFRMVEEGTLYETFRLLRMGQTYTDLLATSEDHHKDDAASQPGAST